MLFDTHAHITDERFNEDRDLMIDRIKREGMLVLNCGCDEKSSYLSAVLAKRYDFFYAAVGMHPHDSKDYTDKFEELIKKLAKEEKVVAIGEIGLDFYYDNSPRDIQREIFIRQIHLADELDLPIIIHSRDASEETYKILKEHLKNPKGAVLHSFSQSTEMLKKYLALDKNIHFSISGPVTFKNARALTEMVPNIPLERIFIETDCPYLTPVPFRGKRNNPTYVAYVADKLSELYGRTTEEIADITAENAMRFFGIKA
ncbi:MAG: TatD family deoxyribonuclease [Anaerofustis stercorihominis]|nr:TatD family deoxyribonuclease [Anaerofustis stercorihominis]